jgi:hypothetical protein
MYQYVSLLGWKKSTILWIVGKRKEFSQRREGLEKPQMDTDIPRV